MSDVGKPERKKLGDGGRELAGKAQVGPGLTRFNAMGG